MFTIPVGLLGGFSPLSISGARAWLRSDLGITLSGSNVSTWVNQVAGVSGDATQGTDSKRPVYNTGGLGGNPYLTFDGAKGMEWALDLQGAKSIVTIFDQASEPHSGFSLYSIKGSTGPVFSESITDLATYDYVSWISDVSSTGVASVGFNDALGTTGHVLIQTYDGGAISTTTSYTAQLDSVAKTVTASGTFARVLTDLGSLGSRLNSTNAVTFGLIGDYYEVIVYNKVLSSTEMTQIANYAIARYGI